MQDAPDVASAGYEYDFACLYTWETGYSIVVNVVYSERIQHRSTTIA